MRKLIFMIIGFFTTFISLSQELKEIDFVIVVDDEVINAVQGLTIQIKEKNNEVVSISPNYHPGSLSFDNSIYDKLQTEDVESVKIVFSYSQNCKKKIVNYFYEISYNRKWFKEPFNVLKIFNLDKRKYRKKYKLLNENVNYSLSLDLGSYSVLKI